MSKGVITNEWTIWCGSPECEHWETDAMSSTKGEATMEWKHAGWRKVGGVWTCPRCVKGEPEPKPTRTNTIVWFPASGPSTDGGA